MYVCATCVEIPSEAREGVRSPEPEITSSCEWPNVGPDSHSLKKQKELLILVIFPAPLVSFCWLFKLATLEKQTTRINSGQPTEAGNFLDSAKKLTRSLFNPFLA